MGFDSPVERFLFINPFTFEYYTGSEQLSCMSLDGAVVRGGVFQIHLGEGGSNLLYFAIL